MASLLYSPVFGITDALKDIILSPLLAPPLLVSATYYPEVVRDALTTLSTHLPDALSSAVSLPGLLDNPAVMTGLKVLAGLATVRKLNSCLNTMAHNSWRLFKARGWDNWADEIAVVTGGSSGIGRDIVERLARQGVRVAVFDIVDLPKEMQGSANIKFYRCDVTSPESVASAADAVRRDLGHPSILINNAGLANTASIIDTDPGYLQKIMGVNLLSHWYTTKQFVPNMVQNNKGHVVTIASLASFVSLCTSAPYSATKAGVLAFHEVLTSEIKHQYKSPNVLTTVVHPNFVRTNLLSDFSDRLDRAGIKFMTTDVIGEAVVRQIKSKRGGQLVLPSSGAGASAVRGLPTWIQEVIRDAIGRGSAA